MNAKLPKSTLLIGVLWFVLLYLVSCTNAESAKNVASTPFAAISTTMTPTISTTLIVSQQHPLPTATLGPTINAMSPISDIVIAIIEQNPPLPNSILLQDLSSGSSWRLQFEGAPKHVQWSSNGCQLYVTLRTSSSVKIVNTDLRGSVLQEDLNYIPKVSAPESNTYQDKWALSPSGKLIAYIAYSGKQYYSTSEIQNIEIISNNLQNRLFVLTKYGGALSFSWSPDGNSIAYSDYDGKGVRQLYVSKFDGSDKKQLTHFTDKGMSIGEFRGNYIGMPVWSYDSKDIAFDASVINADKAISGSVWIVSANGDRQTKVSPENFPHVSILGWSEDNTSIAFNVRTEQNDGGENNTIYFVSVGDNHALNILGPSGIPEGYLAGAFPVDNIYVLAIPKNKGGFYLYDSRTEQLITTPSSIITPSTIIEINPAPYFHNKVSCGN